MPYLLLLIFVIYIYNFFSSSDWKENVEYTRPKDFETSLLALSAIIIKADGIINKTELNYVRNYFIRTYGKEKANHSFRNFKKLVQNRTSSRELCARISNFMAYPARVQLIKFLFDVANSDGNVSASEELEIRKIASYMLIRQMDYIRLRLMYFNNQRTDYSYSQSSDYEYEILGLSENATNDEIKKAYRTLVKKYHPDRLQNASKEDITIAKEKFQKIQSAYEKIKSKRGF